MSRMELHERLDTLEYLAAGVLALVSLCVVLILSIFIAVKVIQMGFAEIVATFAIVWFSADIWGAVWNRWSPWGPNSGEGSDGWWNFG